MTPATHESGKVQRSCTGRHTYDAGQSEQVIRRTVIWEVGNVLRRTSYRWSALLLSLGLVASGCSSGENGIAGDENSGAGRTTLHVAVNDEIGELTPFKGLQQTQAAVLSTMLMGLLRTDSENEIYSEILDSWDMSDDARTVTLKLRQGLEWSDGTPITSADIVMSLTQYFDPSISTAASQGAAVVGQAAFVEGNADSISGISAPDSHTVVIELESPDAGWLPDLASVTWWWRPILPAHILGDVPHDELLDHDYFKTYPVTNGPFKFVDYVDGQHVEFVRNENWSLGDAGFERLFFRVMADADVMSAQLETGEIQYAYMVDAVDVDRIDALDGVEIQSTTGVAPDVLGLQHHEPLLDRRVRQAMLYAIDREGICQEVLQGYCTIPVTNTRLIGPAWAIPSDGMTEYRYDPDRARELLDEAGWDPSTELTLLHRPGRKSVDRALAIAQGNMADVGINWTIENTDTAGLLEQFDDPESWEGFWVTGANFTIDPSIMETYTACDSGYPNGGNVIQYCNEELDRMFATGTQVVAQDERANAYHDAFRLLNKEVPEIYLYVADSIVAYDSRLEGVKLHGDIASQHWNIGEWRWDE